MIRIDDDLYFFFEENDKEAEDIVEGWFCDCDGREDLPEWFEPSSKKHETEVDSEECCVYCGHYAVKNLESKLIRKIKG